MVNAVEMSVKFDVTTVNGVNFKESLIGAYKFVRTFKGTNCGSESVTSSSTRPDELTSVSWYVSGGKQCTVVDTITVELGYQPGLTFGTSNTFTTPSISSLKIKGYDLKTAIDLFNTVNLVCSGSPLTSCTISAPVQAKLKIAVNFESVFEISGYNLVLEIGANLKRLFTRMLAVSLLDSYSCTGKLCNCPNGCNPYNWDICLTTSSLA